MQIHKATMAFNALRSLPTLLERILYLTQNLYVIHLGILSSSANQCILGIGCDMRCSHDSWRAKLSACRLLLTHTVETINVYSIKADVTHRSPLARAPLRSSPRSSVSALRATLISSVDFLGSELTALTKQKQVSASTVAKLLVIKLGSVTAAPSTMEFREPSQVVM